MVLLQGQEKRGALRISHVQREGRDYLLVLLPEKRVTFASMLWPDAEVCRIWGLLAHSAGKDAEGRPRHSMNLWIAATAIRYGLPLLTGNRKHFEGIAGLTLL